MSPRILLPTLPCAEPLEEVVLFGFDDRAFPFQNHVQTHLIPGQNPVMVLPPGEPGTHDEQIRYYGTVIRIEDQFCMWYNAGHGSAAGATGYVRAHFAPCYATSSDGVDWEKPNLGLVEFHGSKANNLIDFPERSRMGAMAVLYEPDDPDPDRRFKMAYEAPFQGKTRFGVAFSRDGLCWTASERNPVGPFLEMAGITRFRGLYYVNGQPWLDVQRPVLARQLVTFVSADFEHWSPCHAMGLERSHDLIGPSQESHIHSYEEVHLGAAMWNRGNVLVGIYGQWHGHSSGDRRMVTMDLGLALSHDAIHFHEPIPGFRFVAAREQPHSPQGIAPALMQGQGMENVGEKTLYWYSLWTGPEGSGVRMVSWERDRLGMLKPFRPWWPGSRTHQSAMQAISCPIEIVNKGAAKVYVNASGLGEHSHLRIDLLDHGFRPIPGYSGADGARMAADGYRSPLRWGAGEALVSSQGRVQLAVHFEGVRAEDCQLHALYLT